MYNSVHESELMQHVADRLLLRRSKLSDKAGTTEQHQAVGSTSERVVEVETVLVARIDIPQQRPEEDAEQRHAAQSTVLIEIAKHVRADKRARLHNDSELRLLMAFTSLAFVIIRAILHAVMWVVIDRPSTHFQLKYVDTSK
jgi:hypothetical protein